MCIFAPKKKNMEEIWKDIEGFEDLYQVSNMGRVRSLTRNKKGKNGVPCPIQGRIMKQHICFGYYYITLSKNGKYKGFRVHRLVANAFIPNPDNLPQVNHKDENKANNCVDNLEWCDSKYNVNYGTGTERSRLSNTNGKCSKTVLQYSLDGTFIKEWKSTMDVQRNLGFANSHISECCRGEQAYGYGYLWKYKKEIE